MADKAVYSTKKAADVLALSTSSVRKYCVELEAAGKTFVKTESGARLFDDIDIKTLQYMQRAINKGVKYPKAAEQAVKAVNINAVMTQEKPPQQESMQELKAVIGELVNEVRRLREDVAILKSAELDRQHEEALRIDLAINEARTPASVEKTLPQIEEKPEAKKRGLFGRIFGRG